MCYARELRVEVCFEDGSFSKLMRYIMVAISSWPCLASIQVNFPPCRGCRASEAEEVLIKEARQILKCKGAEVEFMTILVYVQPSKEDIDAAIMYPGSSGPMD